MENQNLDEFIPVSEKKTFAENNLQNSARSKGENLV
jgi:hypothetical protein